MTKNETAITKREQRRVAPFLYALTAVTGVASLVETRLAVFAVLLLIIALASVSSTRTPPRGQTAWTWVLSGALVISILGLGRFIFQEALPGISEAKGRDSSKRAVSLLREIYFAENAMRRYAMIDPDGDGVGGAGRLAELTGHAPARGRRNLQTLPLAPRLAPLIETAHGPATEHEGYLVLVCVPKAGGGLTAQMADPVDEERAERRWIAYAWPQASGLPHKQAYAIDEHEGIFELDNENERGLIYVGAAYAPPCDALVRPEGPRFRPWGGKKPRLDLPGDREAGPSEHL